jgi:AraC-like DNA-binding protein
MAVVIPGQSDAMTALHCEHILAAFLRVFGAYFCAGVRMFEHGVGLTPFAQRHAAFAILLSLLVASEQDGAAGSPATVRISIAELARRFGVSRPQVARVLDEAVEAHFVERSGPDRLTVPPRLRRREPRLLCHRILALRPLYADGTGSKSAAAEP